MTGVVAYKMTGSGNDFVMLDGRVSAPEAWSADTIRAVCDRRRGVGADAVVFVAPGSAPNRARMVYFNSDGSRAPMCGNAALCSTQLARRLEMVERDEIELETDTATYLAACVGRDRAKLRLGRVGPATPLNGVSLLDGEVQAASLQVGVPHLLVLVKDVDAVEVEARGRELRQHPAAGPSGANVNFVAPDPRGPDSWRMRTYERGVEAETYACGTGAVAAGVWLAGQGLARLPAGFLSRTGLTIGVSGDPVDGATGTFDEVWLEGESLLLFRAVLGL